MSIARVFSVLILASALFGQTPIFPLREIQAGQHGIGKTVFSGNKIEEFQVEILGVLENLGPQAIRSSWRACRVGRWRRPA